MAKLARSVGARVLSALLLSTSCVGAATVRSVPLCSGITLSASYLVEGPSFLFTLTNHTLREIRLAEPVPSSSDWYARSHDRWMWRASNGSGGSLVDASHERGRVRVYPPPPGEVKLLTLPPHQSKQWTERQQENPVLAYNPGCKLCSYPGEREYQVVFAYAYIGPGLLPCGLRSAPVPMPPKNRSSQQ